MSQITEETFEHALNQFLSSPTIDLKDTAFIDPYGMVGILEIGELLKSKGIRKTIQLPQSEEVLKYLERMDFFKFANRYFALEPSKPNICEKYLRSSYTDVLLEITPIQKYHFQKNINKNVVKIAVMDLGIGFRKSLSERFSIKDDIEAIEKALLYGVSRYADEGRGHGLAAVRRFVNQWNGKLSPRSDTARCSSIPESAWGNEKELNLAHFPGSQINILLPE